jgi:hypothetical protein
MQAEARSGGRWAEGAQWVLYVAICAALVYPWYVLVRNFGWTTTDGHGPQWTVAWLLASCLLIGVHYRHRVRRKGSVSVIGYALFIPVVASLARSVLLGFASPSDSMDVYGESTFFSRFFVSLIYAYTCGGIFIIPLAAGHVWAMGAAHRSLERWSRSAGRRSIRHAWYAIASLALLGASEGPARYVRWRTETTRVAARRQVTEIAQMIDLPLPEDAKIVASSATANRRRRWWFHAAHLKWPASEGFRPLSEPDREVDVVGRLRAMAGAPAAEGVLGVSQRKWSGYNSTGPALYVGRLVRRRVGGDYLEVVANPVSTH